MTINRGFISKQVGIFALLVSLSAGSAALANFDTTELGAPVNTTEKDSRNFWSAATDLVQRCTVQPIHIDRGTGQPVAGLLRSTCPELKVVAQQIHFQLNETKYVADVTISHDADGDDLNDVIVKDENGQFVGARKNVLAFNDPLLALAGGAGLHFNIVSE